MGGIKAVLLGGGKLATMGIIKDIKDGGFQNRYGIFYVCAPQYVMLPPVTEHVSLHSKSLCKNIVRASGGCK